MFHAEIAHNAFSLCQVVIGGDALVFVQTHLVVEFHTDLVQRQKTARLGSHCHAGQRMRVHHTDRVGPRGVDGRMNDEASGIDGRACLLPRLSVGVDFNQRARGDLLEKKPVRIDEKAMALTRNSRRKMREHEVRHPEERDETIRRGEVLAELNLGGRAVWRGRLRNGWRAMLHRVIGSRRIAGDRRARFGTGSRDALRRDSRPRSRTRA